MILGLLLCSQYLNVFHVPIEIPCKHGDFMCIKSNSSKSQKVFALVNLGTSDQVSPCANKRSKDSESEKSSSFSNCNTGA